MPSTGWDIAGYVYVILMLGVVAAYAADSVEKRFGTLSAAGMLVVCMLVVSIGLGVLL